MSYIGTRLHYAHVDTLKIPVLCLQSHERSARPERCEFLKELRQLLKNAFMFPSLAL